MFCSKCGQSMQDGAQFCHACGNKISVESMVQSPSPVVQPITQGASNCYHHSTEHAAASCRRCGKAICSDCMEAFTPSSGPFEQQCLCYDCYSSLLQTNIHEIADEKERMLDYYNRLNFRLKIGAGVGVALGLYQFIRVMSLTHTDFGGRLVFGIFSFIFSVIGWMTVIGFFKEYVNFMIHGTKEAFHHATRTPDVYTNMATGFMAALIKPFVLLYQLVRQYLDTRKTIQHYDFMLDSENRSLQWAKDQMAFWNVRNKNKNVSIRDLINIEPSLQNNAYAQHLNNN